MFTTEEAGKILGISKRRVQALLKEGLLEGKKISGVWLVDEDSVNARLKNTNKRGGRPTTGTRRKETCFILMNRTHEIAELVYNNSRKTFSKISDIDLLRAPIGLTHAANRINLDDFNAWWRMRGIPQTRLGLANLLSEAGVAVPEDLLQRNLGLSLSDQYWIRPTNSSLKWEEVNFFNNSFEEVSLITKEYTSANKKTRACPDNTSDGNLSKTWECRNNIRVLIKGGLSYGQEPYNEVVASALHQRLLDPHEYVQYHLEGEGALARCVCPLFLTDEEEYVPAYYVERLINKENTSRYEEYLEACNMLGVLGIKEALSRMIVCDDIIANHDRHHRNFGIIRNVETLACRPAPIFDSGSSLWCNIETSKLAQGEHSFTSKQFYESPAKQMLLVDDMSWFNSEALIGFSEEAIAILSKNEALKDRLPYVQKALNWRIERMCLIAEWN